jgi:hypothetical protein
MQGILSTVIRPEEFYNFSSEVSILYDSSQSLCGFLSYSPDGALHMLPYRTLDFHIVIQWEA